MEMGKAISEGIDYAESRTEKAGERCCAFRALWSLDCYNSQFRHDIASEEREARSREWKDGEGEAERKS